MNNTLINTTITSMFETSIDGFLYMPAWPVYMETEDSGSTYKIKIEYNSKEEALEKSMQEALRVHEGLQILGDWYAAHEVPFGTRPEDDLDQASMESALYVWERYIKDFNNQEEADLLLKDCKERVGGGIAAYHEVIRAVRLCRLISLSAPDLIKDHEEALFLKAFMVNQYGVSIEEVGDENPDPLTELLEDPEEEGYGLMVRDGMLEAAEIIT